MADDGGPDKRVKALLAERRRMSRVAAEWDASTDRVLADELLRALGRGEPVGRDGLLRALEARAAEARRRFTGSDPGLDLERLTVEAAIRRVESLD